MSTPSDRLKEERKRLGVSQVEFAALGGVGKRAQINYESGDRNPDADYLARVAEHGADVLYVLTGVRAAVHQKLGSIAQARDLLLRLNVDRDVGAQLLPLLTMSMGSAALGEDESELLDLWRRCNDADRAVISQMAARFASEEAPAAPAKKRSSGPRVMQNFNAPVEQVGGRDIINKGKKR